MGLPGDNLDAVLLTRDKIKMRAHLGKHDFCQVRHRVCHSVEDAQRFLDDVGGPVVLKPFDGGGSIGVCLVESGNVLEERWSWTRGTTQDPILAEEFLQGPEFSVESISKRGHHEVAMITEKVTTEIPRFVELGHQMPAGLDEATTQQVHDLVIRFLTLIGQTTGPAHTEIRMTSTGPKIIESQTRVGGDQIWEMCQMVSGVDLQSEMVACLLGLDDPARVPTDPAVAIRFFSYENTRIVDVQDLDKAQAADGVIRLKCTLEPGMVIGPLESSLSRQGYVMCSGKNVHHAIRNAENAADLLKVKQTAL
jgi:biotin carboxylase